MEKRTLEEKYKFVTFILGRMKLSIEHEKKRSEGIGKKIKDKKTPRNLGPADTIVQTRSECLPYSGVVTVMQRANGSMANFSGTEVQRRDRTS